MTGESDLLDQMMTVILARMSVISEQRAQSFEGIRVNGGDKARVPHLDEMPLIDYYRDCYQRALGYHSRRGVVIDAYAALKNARRAPIPSGQEPEYGSPQWKRYIAESREDAGVLAARFSVTRRYINMVRCDYREAA